MSTRYRSTITQNGKTMMRPMLATLALLMLTLAAQGADGRERGWWLGDHAGESACLHCRLEALDARRAAHFDEATGRDLHNFPPHRSADILHMKLEIDIPDMNTPVAHAKQTTTFRPIGRPVDEIRLDAAGGGMLITAVWVEVEGDEGCCLMESFTHENDVLTIRMDPPVPLGTTGIITIEYTLNDPPDGLIWTPESPSWPGRAAQIHTQGQPESNRYWFPTHDFPNERFTTEVVVTVPRGFLASSNGRLVSHERQGNRETWHWLQDKDHVAYLVTLVIGKFEVVDIGTRRLPMPVYVPPGTGKLVKQTYGRTGEMVEHFASLIDEPYPWDRYAQLVVHNFAAGGMENTSATTMYDTAILDSRSLQDGDLDGLISHELAHQWFGDLITCRSWEHIWLNEGFATYFTNLWWEKRDGIAGYHAGVRRGFDSVIAADSANAPFQAAMVSREYGHPWDVFRRAANPYPKGASILHMLRMKLGDEVFFRGLALYVERHKFGVVETADLRKALEEVSGRSLERFFDQWCSRPGVPHLEISAQWDPAASALNISLAQTQNIDGHNPAFFFDLPIRVRLRGRSDWQLFTLSADQRTASLTIPLPSEPDIVAIDPDLHVLARLDITQPQGRWLAQLSAGPTLPARMQAISALAAGGGDDSQTAVAAAALGGLARDRSAEHVLRIAAVEALAKLEADHILVGLIRDLPADARVRLAVIQAAGGVLDRSDAGTPPHDETAAILLRAVRGDGSYAVSAAAITALAAGGHPEALAVSLEGIRVESQHDRVRQSALEALGRLGRPEGLEAAIRLTGPGVNSRTRPVAIRTAAALAEHDPERVVGLLVELLSDRESRTARAAGEALAAPPMSGDPKAAAALQAYAERARSRIERAQAREWLRKIESTEHEPVGSAR